MILFEFIVYFCYIVIHRNLIPKYFRKADNGATLFVIRKYDRFSEILRIML